MKMWQSRVLTAVKSYRESLEKYDHVKQYVVV